MQATVQLNVQRISVHKKTTVVRNILSAVLFLAVIGYSAIYANNTFPISEGWNVNYVELICTVMCRIGTFTIIYPR